jgi:hypothetical protein
LVHVGGARLYTTARCPRRPTRSTCFSRFRALLMLVNSWCSARLSLCQLRTPRTVMHAATLLADFVCAGETETAIALEHGHGRVAFSEFDVALLRVHEKFVASRLGRDGLGRVRIQVLAVTDAVSQRCAIGRSVRRHAVWWVVSEALGSLLRRAACGDSILRFLPSGWVCSVSDSDIFDPDRNPSISPRNVHAACERAPPRIHIWMCWGFQMNWVILSDHLAQARAQSLVAVDSTRNVCERAPALLEKAY